MAQVLPLSFTATVASLETLLNHPPEVTSSTGLRLRELLAADYYTAVTGLILDRLIKIYPHHVRDLLLEDLASPGLQKLEIPAEARLTPRGKFKVLQKCRYLRSLLLTGDRCYEDVLSWVPGILSSGQSPRNSHPPLLQDLTCLSLTNCDSLSDNTIQSLLRSLPKLQQLHLVGCDNITDEVFLLDETKQLMRDNSSASRKLMDRFPYRLDYDCHLVSVDVSNCSQLTTTAVRHLTTLCGPTLKSVNLSGTAVDCAALWFLAGYSLSEAIREAQEVDERFLANLEDVLPPGVLVEVLPSGEIEEVLLLPPSGHEHVGDNLGHLPETKDMESTDRGVNGTTVHMSDRGDVSENEVFYVDFIRTYEVVFKTGLEESKHLPANVPCHCDEYEKVILRGMSSDEKVDADFCICSNCDNCKCQSRSEVADELTNHVKNVPVVQNKCMCLTETESHCADHVTGRYDLEQPSTSGSATYLPSDADTVAGGKGNFLHKDNPDSTAYCTKKGSNDPRQDSDGCKPLVFTPQLQTLNLAHINFDNATLRKACLTALLRNNPGIQQLQMTWEQAGDEMMQIVAEYAPNLRCLCVTGVGDLGMEAVSTRCKNLASLELRDSSFIGDCALVPMLDNGRVTKLGLSATMITDKTLDRISDLCADKLLDLDLSWCEEITENGVNKVVTSCRLLHTLLLRHSPISQHTIHLVAEYCTNIRKMYLPGVNCVTDEGLVALALRLKNLQILDISWNIDVTDVGMSALITHGSRLERLVSIGIKQITTQPFWLLVSDVAALKRCKATLLLEKKLRDAQKDVCSSDEEYEMSLPLRSSVCAPCLRRLELDWCDCASEAQLAEIALVCRGGIIITGYYGEVVKPGFVEDC